MFFVQIVDDEPIVRMGLKKLIPWEELGYQVVCEAQNGQEALEQLKEYDIDLIITDIEMPILNGMEYIKRVRELKYRQSIVILTAYAEFEYAKSAIEHGVSGYILKPISEEQIIDLLKQLKKGLKPPADRSFTREKDKKLIDLVLINDKAAFELLDRIIEEEINYDSEDISGTCLRCYYILEEIVLELNKKYSNLNQLETLDEYLTINQQKYITKEEILEQFKREVKRIFSILEKYMLLYKDNVVRQACRYVVEHVDEKIGLTSISNTLGISKNYFCSLFKQETGDNFLNFVTNTKMQRAKYLLKEKNMRIYEVCNYLGYTDTTYFTKLFKKYSGITPNEYKKTECEKYEIQDE